MRVYLADEVGKPLVTYEGKDIYEVNGSYLQILKLIEDKNDNWTSIYKSVDMASSTLADRLNEMIECGIISKEKIEGKGNRYSYSLNASKSGVVVTPYTDTIILIFLYIIAKFVFPIFSNFETEFIEILEYSIIITIFIYSIYGRLKFRIKKR